MDCDLAQALLHAEMDDELDVVNQLELDVHVSACPACRAARAANSALHAAIAKANLRDQAPAGLERRITAALHADSRPPLVSRLRQAASAVSAHRLGLAASAAAVMLALVAGIAVGRRSGAPGLSDELVDGHVRSLQAGHLTDEASSEHHTIKPWFAGRLDFSPPVPDLSGAGFVLVGARVDYAGGRPVAALVYRRRAHVINLFVWPSADGGEGAGSGSVRGYNFVHDTSGSNQMWAVSDLDPAELRTFLHLASRQ